MDASAVVLSSLGLLVFAIRLVGRRRETLGLARLRPDVDLPSTSIIIPCRNEAANLPALLTSLQSAKFPQSEIIVVDDGSSDATFEVASQFPGVRVLRAPPKPDGWVGKTWACQVGFRASRGEYLLFTDADTRHREHSLIRALSFMKVHQLDGLSAPPFHAGECGWDRYLGFFHLLPLIASPVTGAVGRRVNARTFAIGQYLLFRRDAYERIGGHAAVRDSLAEDLEIARRLGAADARYAAFPEASLYEVQMYPSFEEFYRGWRRIIRMGLSKTTFAAAIEIFLVFHLFATPVWPMLAAFPLLAWIQGRYGRFSVVGALVAPVSILLFTALTAHALVENVFRRPMAWRRRVYDVRRDSSRIAG